MSNPLKNKQFFEFLKGTYSGGDSMVKFLPKEILEKIWYNYVIETYKIVDLIKYGMFDAIKEKYKYRNKNLYVFDYQEISTAIAYNRIDILKWYYTRDNFIDEKIYDYNIVIKYACEYGKLDILKWLCSYYEPFIIDSIYFLEWVIIATHGGYVDIIDYLLFSLNPTYINDPDITKYIVNISVSNNYINILNWLIEKNINIDLNLIDDNSIILACRYGSIDTLKFIHANRLNNYSIDICIYNALSNSHTDILDFLLTIEKEEVVYKLINKNKEGLLFSNTNMNTNMLKWLFDRKIYITFINSNIKNACIIGDIERVKWIYENYDVNKYDVDGLIEAVKSNHKDIVEYLFEEQYFYIYANQLLKFSKKGTELHNYILKFIT